MTSRIPTPVNINTSLQAWAAKGKRLGQKRNATTNPAGTFAKLRVVTKEGVVWETFKRDPRIADSLAILEAIKAGYP